MRWLWDGDSHPGVKTAVWCYVGVTSGSHISSLLRKREELWAEQSSSQKKLICLPLRFHWQIVYWKPFFGSTSRIPSLKKSLDRFEQVCYVKSSSKDEMTNKIIFQAEKAQVVLVQRLRTKFSILRCFTKILEVFQPEPLRHINVIPV